MSRGLVSVVSMLTEDRLGGLSGSPARDVTARTNPRRLPDIDGAANERLRCQRAVSACSLFTESEATPKAVKFSHRSLWCCFFMIMPVVIPVLLYVKDSDGTRRIVLAFVIVIIIIIVLCFSLVIFDTSTRQMLAARRNSDEDDRVVGVHSLRPTLPPVSPNLVAATHRMLSSRHVRPAYRSARTEETPRPQSLVSQMRPTFSSPLRSVASAPSTPSCSTYPVVATVANDDSLHFMQRHMLELNRFRGDPTLPCEGLQPSLLHDNPPPYHIAIDLPDPEILDCTTVETPPPPYENALN